MKDLRTEIAEIIEKWQLENCDVSCVNTNCYACATDKILSKLRESLPAEREIVRHRDHDKLIREYEGWNNYREALLKVLEI